MADKKKLFNLQKGQMIPLIVVLFLVLVGMVALITDGGVLMSNRRTAQAAADAAAMAGAKRACSGYADAISVAESYATSNGATSVSVSLNGTQVTVQASVENETFFSKVFGEDSLDTAATATAGCYSPKGNVVVPLAWYCRPNTEGGPYPSEYDCQMQTLSWDLLRPLLRPQVEGEVSSIPISDYDDNIEDYYLNGTNVVDIAGDPPEQLYIIMDSDKTCLEDGGDYQCDIDEDGEKDLQLGGDRGWLYLSANTSNIADSLSETYNLPSHIWLTGKPGVTSSVFIKMKNWGFEGRIVLVPVYNAICDGNPETNTPCLDTAHEQPAGPPPNGTDVFDEMRHKQNTNYHIIAFQPFYITCVDKNGNCPGYQYAQSLENNKNMKNDPVVEGFFLSDVDLAIDSSQGCSVNLGNCQISLSQ